MIGIWVVDAFRTIDRSAGCAAWGITVALVSMLRVSTMQGCGQAFYDQGSCRILKTFDFLLRHAMQAVLTHRLLADAAEALSLLRDFALVGFVVVSVERLVLLVTGLM